MKDLINLLVLSSALMLNNRIRNENKMTIVGYVFEAFIAVVLFSFLNGIIATKGVPENQGMYA